MAGFEHWGRGVGTGPGAGKGTVADEDHRFEVLVLDNDGLTTERAIADGPFNDIARWDYAAAGRVIGASGVRVGTRSDLMVALERARSEPDEAWIISSSSHPPR